MYLVLAALCIQAAVLVLALPALARGRMRTGALRLVPDVCFAASCLYLILRGWQDADPVLMLGELMGLAGYALIRRAYRNREDS